MKKITVYTMDFCPYCERVKKLFKSKGMAFEEVKLSTNDDAAWDELEKRTRFKTMPQVFIGDQFYGGYNEIAALDTKGELDLLVNS